MSAETERHSDEIPRPSELVAASSAGPQERGESVERALPVALVQEGLRSPDPVALNESVGNLVRSDAARGIVVAALQRGDAFQAELSREREAHAVTKNDLKHAMERSASQLVLQLVGSGLFGWGLTNSDETWLRVGAGVLGLAMILVGALPTITIAWRRRGGR